MGLSSQPEPFLLLRKACCNLDGKVDGQVHKRLPQLVRLTFASVRDNKGTLSVFGRVSLHLRGSKVIRPLLIRLASFCGPCAGRGSFRCGQEPTPVRSRYTLKSLILEFKLLFHSLQNFRWIQASLAHFDHLFKIHIGQTQNQGTVLAIGCSPRNQSRLRWRQT